MFANSKPHISATKRLVQLSADHPGFSDQAYRQRRDHIADLAWKHKSGAPVPAVTYTPEEHRLWREIRTVLNQLYPSRACRAAQAWQRQVTLPEDRLPQLEELNQRLSQSTNFRFEPVAGLVEGRDFLSQLANGVFLSTQYIRHWSRPLYTPEPDVVHELVGHAGSLTCEWVAELNILFGRAAQNSHDAKQLLGIDRLYWFSMEFGLFMEDKQPRAFGAGLLSSCEELADFQERTEIRPWSARDVLATPYDPTSWQRILFAAEDRQQLRREIQTGLELLGCA